MYIAFDGKCSNTYSIKNKSYLLLHESLIYKYIEKAYISA